MNEQELDMLQGIIKEFDAALSEPSENEELFYELVNRADALYGSQIPEITEQLELIQQYHGLLRRNSEAILALLKREYARQKNRFVAGIMPITYENLRACPAAQAVYKSGIEKYAAKQYDRNILDDMRLSLELLVKWLVNNSKSLEHQKPFLGDKMKSFHTEVKNLVMKTVDYLCKYQNDYVKHDDDVNEAEIDFIIEQTSATINFLLKLNQE